jgi:hypothetical protein
VRPRQRLAISDNWNHLMRPHDMKYIGFKHQRENKQNSDNRNYQLLVICHARSNVTSLNLSLKKRVKTQEKNHKAVFKL